MENSRRQLVVSSLESRVSRKTKYSYREGTGGIAPFFLRSLFILLALFPLIGPGDASAAAPANLSPDFTLTTLAGKRIHYYEDLKGKKPAYLVFWATW